MIKYSIYIFFMLLTASFSCKQNGDLSKDKSKEFEEVSKEIEQLENPSAQDYSSNKTLAPVYQIKVIKTFPHDPSAYTQGLLIHNGFFYESTGLTGHSTLRKVEISSGKVLKTTKVQGNHFAEGIEIYKDKIFQLTWITQTCFVYNLNTFELTGSFSYRGEGWGLTKIDDKLIMSNGSNILKFINPANFEEVKTLAVNDGVNPIFSLNELEYIKGEIWANIYQSSKIARINPETGYVNSYVDLSSLYKYVSAGDNPDVLNGIAYDIDNDKIYVTGKYWSYVFLIEVIEK